MAPPPPVHALIGDLFFRARVEAVAHATGVPVAFVGAPDDVPDGDDRALVLVDLSAPGSDPLDAIRALKARDDPPTVLAFGPHREVDRFEAARAAGADRVLARSAFTERLPEILRSADPSAGEAGD